MCMKLQHQKNTFQIFIAVISLQYVKESFNKVEDMPQLNTKTLRKVARKISDLGGRGSTNDVHFYKNVKQKDANAERL